MEIFDLSCPTCGGIELIAAYKYPLRSKRRWYELFTSANVPGGIIGLFCPTCLKMIVPSKLVYKLR